MRFRLGNIQCSISFWFITIIALFALLGQAVFFFYTLVPVLIHETGHLLALFLLGGKVTAVYLEPFGIEIVKQTRPGMAYSGDIVICVAGALMNIIAALSFRLFAYHTMRSMLMEAANIAVALFNLLPIGNLDGGTLIRLIGERLWGVGFGQALSRILSLLTLGPLFGLSLFLIVEGIPNLSLLVVCIYLIGVIILNG